MAQMIRSFGVIALKCPSCSAKLEVENDMERFACGYCGMELMAHRRGGTISLKAISDALSKVQTGTDKTAAELAIQRFEGDKTKLVAAANFQLPRANRSVLLGVAAGLVSSFIVAAMQDAQIIDLGFGAVVITFFACVVGGVFWAAYQRQSILAGLQERCRHLNDKIAAIRYEISLP